MKKTTLNNWLKSSKISNLTPDQEVLLFRLIMYYGEGASFVFNLGEIWNNLFPYSNCKSIDDVNFHLYSLKDKELILIQCRDDVKTITLLPITSSERKARKNTNKHPFSESPIYDKERFLLTLAGTIYQDANINYYWEVINNWALASASTKYDWLAFARNWMLKDMKEGIFVTKNYTPNENANSRNTRANSVDVRSAYEKLSRMSN